MMNNIFIENNPFSLLNLLPVLPFTVREVAHPGSLSRHLGRAFRVQNCSSKGLLVLAKVCVEADSEVWLHVSFSRRDRIPDWSDTTFVKNTFIGEDKEAYVKLPKQEEYVNFHPYCLHLWSCLSKPNYLPDFRPMEGII
jgi:hypothetical protein